MESITTSPRGSTVLSQDDERDLIKRTRCGDTAARNRILLAFRPLAGRMASEAARRWHQSREDLEQEAWLAIAMAIDTFDLRRRIRFATHAQHQIKGALTSVCRRDDRARIIDISKGPRRLPAPAPEATGEVQPASAYWPPAAIAYVRQIRRRNDREIAKMLWLTVPAWRQADIARKLKISRSAVTQRRQRLVNVLQRRFGISQFSQVVTEHSLNSFDPDDIYEYEGW